MVYNDLIFIHIPKTGGSSIRSSLSKNYDLIYNANKENLIKLGYSNFENFENYKFSIHNFKDHLPYQLIKKNKLEKNKYVFTFIRNPFSRVVSMYFECMANKFHIDGLNTKKNISFEDFVEIINKKPYWFALPMVDYIGIKNIDDIDFIGRFENFENDILKLKKKVKISIKHHNFNNHIKSKLKFGDYRKFYSNNKIIDKVNQIYDKDLRKFKYDYEKFLDFEKKKIKLTTIFLRVLKRKIINLL
tara:strand:- start:757 stop:1491 length:735 start_codon:yes stop_codon:yes gene_type:complete